MKLFNEVKEMKCYKCGKEIEETDVNGLCPKCFEQENPLFEIPDEISKKVCKKCLSYKKEGRWIDPETTDIVKTTFEVAEEAIIENIKLNDGIDRWFLVPSLPDQVEEGELYVTYAVIRDHSDRLPGDVTLALNSVGKLVENVLQIKEKELRIRTVPGQCERCSKMNGGYFESIVQVRADNRDLYDEEREKIIETAEDKIKSILEEDRMGFLSKYESKKEGLDFYMGSKSSARKLAEELKVNLGGNITETYRTVGWNNQESKEVKRNTILLRVPEFREGDFVKIKTDDDYRYYRVESVSKNRTRLISLENGDEYQTDNEDIELVEREEEEEKGLLVSKGEGTLQVMRMDNYETLDLVDPGLDVPEGDKIRIIELDRKFFAIPN
mgnify:CR=1 FL=1